MGRTWNLAAVTVVLLLGSACGASPDVIPASLESQVDRSLTYEELRAAPESYEGRLVVLGGELLRARHVEGGTELTVLALPLDGDARPLGRRLDSRGRFIALDRNAPDPSAFPVGIPVTVVGEVGGGTLQQVDEVEERYPLLEVRHLHLWTEDPAVRRRLWGPTIGVGIGIGGGFGGGGFGFGGISFGTVF